MGSFKMPQPKGAPRQVVINLGSIASRTPLNIFRNANEALRRGLAEPDLEGGVTIAIGLVLLGLETASRLGGWAAPIGDIRLSFLQLRGSCLGISRIARGRTANINSEILKACEDTLQILGDARAS